jgi:hypothetical protein
MVLSKRVKKSHREMFEGLEGRQLMTAAPWVPASKLIGLDAAVAHYPQLTGKGEAVAIIDSGVDYKHPSLGGGFGAGKKVEAGWDFISNDADPMSDTFAHGTGAAGVISADGYVYKNEYNQGIAPGVKIIALRQENALGVKESLDWVLNNRAKYNIVAVNMVNFDGGSGAIYADVLKRLIAEGVFISQPAGTGGASAPLRPALDAADFAVGSVNFSDQVSSFSQRGSGLDLLAPGEHVTIPYYDVKTKKSVYTDAADGTSWASPAVVGTAALIKQINPKFTPAQIMQIMQESGKPVYDPVSKLTYKRLNVDAALTLAYARRDGVSTTPPVTAPVTPPVTTPPVTPPVTTPPVTPPPVTTPPVTTPPVLTPPESAPVVATTPQSPFSGKRVRIEKETTIEAEKFDNGGERVAFHDTEVANLGKVGNRGKGVDLLKDKSGATYVGYTRTGEWLEYSVTVAKAGTYDINARVSSLKIGGHFHIEIDGVNKTGTLTVPNTGNWGSWTMVGKSGVALTAGDHVVRLTMDSVGQSGGVGDFDWIRFSPMSVPTAPTSTPNASKPLFAIGADECLGSAALSSYLGYLDEGDVLAYHGVDFGSGATKFTANVAADKGRGGKRIQVRLDSPTGKIVGTLTVQETGSWTTFAAETTNMTRVTGVHDIFLTFAGGYGVANLDWFKFS